MNAAASFMLKFLFWHTLLLTINAYSLKGKTALVTGSSGGIGAGIARRLASEGANVILHYNQRRQGALDVKSHIEESRIGSTHASEHCGGKCLGIIQCDFRRNANIQKLVEALPDDINIDVLINNAGVITKMAVDDDDDEVSQWHETMQVNVHAPLLLSKLIKKKKMKREGVIVNVSSIHGERSVEYMGAYAASKAALDSLTRCLALEWAPDNIRVNAIAPGVVPVERTQQAFADPNVSNMWLEKLPTNKLGTVEQVAEATLSLITNEWITGTVWIIDGGQLSRGNYPNRPRPPSPPPTTSTSPSDNVTFEI